MWNLRLYAGRAKESNGMKLMIDAVQVRLRLDFRLEREEKRLYIRNSGGVAQLRFRLLLVGTRYKYLAMLVFYISGRSAAPIPTRLSVVQLSL